MTRTIIKVENLSKQYVIGACENARETFREMIVSAVAAPFRRLKYLSGRVAPEECIWALKGVNFEVAEGEVVGIIGRNGAGKSTLLKVLSRITAPTEGRVTLRGRVASLLEVGTGFHPELTGYENIYLNGTILGMRRAEIDRKFDAIVDFSGVEKFLGTPMKRFSSGMQVRLAFAVAAHLDPEILIVDEVLAVGDAEFQSKCLGKMGDVARSGRTVLFVSHNMAAVENLCTRALLLERGTLKQQGAVGDVVRTYLETSVVKSGDVDVRGHAHRISGAKAIVQRFRILDGNGRAIGQMAMGEEVMFVVELNIETPNQGFVVGLHFYDWRGQRVTTLHTAYQSKVSIEETGELILRCHAHHLDLMPGTYHVVLGVDGYGDEFDRIDPVTSFDVVPRDVFGTGRFPPAKDGVFFCRATWSFRATSDHPEANLGSAENLVE